MNSFFSKLRQQVSFHQINPDSEDQDDIADAQSQSAVFAASSAQNGNTEVDDFLMVDADNPIRSNGSSLSSHMYPDSPPTYRQVSESDKLPSYQSVLSGSYTIVSGCEVFSEAFSPLKSKEKFPHHNQKSVISDVPFQLHPTLKVQKNIHEILNSLDLKHASFDWFKNSYEFKMERLMLRDFISDEMKNMDEFIVPATNSQSCDKES